MKNTFFIIIILALTSCSNRSSNDLQNMNFYGNIKSIYEEKRDSNNELIMTKQTHFTNSGMVKSIEFHFPDKQVSNKTINHYDIKGRLTRQDFIMNDSLMLSQEYININSNKDSLLAYDSNGDLVNTAVLVYNNDKQVVVSKLFDLQNTLIYSELSKYDENNRLKETKIKRPDSSSDSEIYTYSYDSLGRLQTYSEKNLINDYEFNESYSYESDKMNNWITKQILSSEGKHIATLSRKIEYK